MDVSRRLLEGLVQLPDEPRLSDTLKDSRCLRLKKILELVCVSLEANSTAKLAE